MTNYSRMAEQFLAEQVKSRGNLPKISKELNIPKAWLYKVAQGKIPNPQVNRVMAILKYKESDKEAA